jgi:molybdopterin-guanine dinucleotide biosynthesis protein B
MNTAPDIPICQVVGYKNAGKTTLMNRLISYFTKQGVRVGTLKHHGHGGEPDVAADTDSYRHTEAGAAISAVQGGNALQVTIKEQEKRPLADILPLYSFLPIDLLLIEGYKGASFPKIVLIRDGDDFQLPDKLTNVIAVGSLNAVEENDKYNMFSIKELETVLPHLASLIKGDKT